MRAIIYIVYHIYSGRVGVEEDEEEEGMIVMSLSELKVSTPVYLRAIPTTFLSSFASVKEQNGPPNRFQQTLKYQGLTTSGSDQTFGIFGGDQNYCLLEILISSTRS